MTNLNEQKAKERRYGSETLSPHAGQEVAPARAVPGRQSTFCGFHDADHAGRLAIRPASKTRARFPVDGQKSPDSKPERARLSVSLESSDGGVLFDRVSNGA